MNCVYYGIVFMYTQIVDPVYSFIFMCLHKTFFLIGLYNIFCCLLNKFKSMSTFTITWHSYFTMLCQISLGCILLELRTSQFSEFIRVVNNSKSISLIQYYKTFCYLRPKCHTRYLFVCIMLTFMKFKSIVYEHGFLSNDPFEVRLCK